jgi:hypothetical protein
VGTVAAAAGATVGVSVRGTACARWKKFHFFDGFGNSFSTTFPFFEDFSHLPSLLSAATSAESLRSFAEGTFAPSVALIARDVRLDASAGRKDFFESSSLSEGLRRPSGVFFRGD